MVNWFKYGRSKELEHQVKYFIASTIEGYLNGCHNEGWDPMKRDEWIKYVLDEIERSKGTYVNGTEYTHLRFYGKDKIINLINEYIDRYAPMTVWIEDDYRFEIGEEVLVSNHRDLHEFIITKRFKNDHEEYFYDAKVKKTGEEFTWLKQTQLIKVKDGIQQRFVR